MSFETDDAAARELILFAENDGDLYRQTTQAILKNLATKKAAGKYDGEKAVQGFMYLAEAGARAYAKNFDNEKNWHSIFPMSVRRAAATHWRDEFEKEYALGNYDDMIPKKYQKPQPVIFRVEFWQRRKLWDEKQQWDEQGNRRDWPCHRRPSSADSRHR